MRPSDSQSVATVSPRGFLTSMNMTEEGYATYLASRHVRKTTPADEAFGKRIDDLVSILQGGQVKTDWAWFMDVLQFAHDAMGPAPASWLFTEYHRLCKVDPLRAEFIADTLGYVLVPDYIRVYQLETWASLLAGDVGQVSVSPETTARLAELSDLIGQYSAGSFMSRWVSRSSNKPKWGTTRPDILFTLQILFGN